MGARLDIRCLQKRRRGWYAVQEVPRPLRSAFIGAKGRPMKRLVRSLHTADLHLAIARRHAVLAEFARQFESARLRLTGDPVIQAALEWRQTIAELERGNLPHFTTREPDPGQTDQENRLSVAYAAIDDEADSIARGDGTALLDRDIPGRAANPAAADAFSKIAKGLATPFQPMLETWLCEADLESRSKGDHRRAIKELLAWAPTASVPPTVEAFDRKVAGHYVSHLLDF